MEPNPLCREVRDCPGFRWSRGMTAVWVRHAPAGSVTEHALVTAVGLDGNAVYDGPGWDGDSIASGLPPDAVPDLTDWHTTGALLGLLLKKCSIWGIFPHRVDLEIPFSERSADFEVRRSPRIGDAWRIEFSWPGNVDSPRLSVVESSLGEAAARALIIVCGQPS